jgi:hypothetical protein
LLRIKSLSWGTNLDEIPQYKIIVLAILKKSFTNIGLGFQHPSFLEITIQNTNNLHKNKNKYIK